MNVVDKIGKIKSLAPDINLTDAEIGVFLERAESDILARRYPFGIPEGVMFPERYDMLSVNLAVRYISRAGAEGETVHTENGVSRSYATADDADLLNKIVPCVGV